MRDKSTMNDVSYSLFGDKNDYTKPYLFQRWYYLSFRPLISIIKK
jgi:hypothetical protein